MDLHFIMQILIPSLAFASIILIPVGYRTYCWWNDIDEHPDFEFFIFLNILSLGGLPILFLITYIFDKIKSTADKFKYYVKGVTK